MTGSSGSSEDRSRGLRGRLRYAYNLAFWWCLNRWRRVAAFLKRHLDVTRRATYILAAAAIGVVIYRFGGWSLSQTMVSGYLVAAGAMTGATIAIVFTISIFLLQNTSDIYSSQYLQVYLHDWRENAVYFTVILITLVLLGAGLWVGSLAAMSSQVQSVLLPTSLILVGTVFALIDWQYKLVGQKITPSATIAFLEKEGAGFLRRLQYDAGKLAGIMQAQDESVPRGVALAAAYNRFLQPSIAGLDRQLENLIELSVKLAERHEGATARRGLTAVDRILVWFLEARKTSTLILPSRVAVFATESDSQSFLTRNCERLNAAGEIFIRHDQDELAGHVMRIYGELAAKSKDITFIPQRGENPIFNLFTAYLKFLIESGQRKQHVEVVYQGSGVLGDVAAIAAESGLGPSLLGLQDALHTAAVFGLTQKQTVVIDRCTMTLLRVVDAVFGSESIDRQNQVSSALEKIASIAAYQAKLLASGFLSNDFSTSLSLTKPYEEMDPLLHRVTGRYAQVEGDAPRDRYRHDLVHLFGELHGSLRRLAEDVKDCDSLLAECIARLLFRTNSLIISLIRDDGFADQRGDLRSRLAWNVHLPGWFAYYALALDGGQLPFTALADCVAKTGIVAAEVMGDRRLVNDCIDALAFLAEQCLEKTTSKYGFDEPRVLEKACYLGILGLKRGWSDVVTNVGLKIYEFEARFVTKYSAGLPAGVNLAKHSIMGLPHSDQLVRELWRWREEFERDRRRFWILEDAQSMMADVIDEVDIDRFIFEVWGVRLADTPFDREVRLARARKQLVGTLERILDQKRRG